MKFYSKVINIATIAILSYSLANNQLNVLAQDQKKPETLAELIAQNTPTNQTREISKEVIDLENKINESFANIQNYEKSKDRIKEYKKEFDNIKSKVNPHPFGGSAWQNDSSTLVDDGSISKEIKDLISKIEGEKYKGVYESLKNEIKDFKYFNVGMSVSWNPLKTQFSGGGRNITGIAVQKYYNKEVTEMYLFNPFEGSKKNISVPGYFKGKHASLNFYNIPNGTGLQDWYKNNPNLGKPE
jgi:hypothetical protein